ncbi:HGxxPAAW family protein [Ornithinicoccus halotolerans]|uniref:HGxxPAAW family protein n=1 Tax=Ornithinicoccus halotolerans TaxID=1748220 RepID=UPI001294D584|nr:HGxxPAAW family protein [Ornithinicoccus halotolerans]
MDEPGHGHSLAAWTGVALLLLASTLLAVGIFFGWAWANWTGVALVPIGAGAWYGLSKAGYDEKSWHARPRR